MRGIILAGGTGSRLRPLTNATINKHVIAVGPKPMIFWPIEALVSAGITDILIVTGTEHAGSVINCLGSGSQFGANFTFKIQDEAGGIAQALNLAKDFCHCYKFCVMLGDNIFEKPINKFVEEFQNQSLDTSKILLKRVTDPKRFGVAVFDEKENLVGVEEKPENPKSNLIVTGCYFYDSNVFSVIPKLKPSARGELEVSDLNTEYIKQGKMSYNIINGEWIDCGTFPSLAKANNLVNKL